MTPIYIITFKRDEALRRCLQSIRHSLHAVGTGAYRVLIFQDGGAHSQAELVETIRKSFEVSVEHHLASRNLGICGNHERVFRHIIESGVEGGIVIEEDCLLAPSALQFVKFAAESLPVDNFAQLSFYNFEFNELAKCETFRPRLNSDDVFLCRQCSSWGFYISTERLKHFFDAGGFAGRYTVSLPKGIEAWPDRTWKKHFIRYMRAYNLFSLCPFVGLASTQGAAGQNIRTELNYSRSQVFLEFSGLWRVNSLSNQPLILDEFLEVETTELGEAPKSIEFNLYGLKDLQDGTPQVALAPRPRDSHEESRELSESLLFQQIETHFGKPVNVVRSNRNNGVIRNPKIRYLFTFRRFSERRQIYIAFTLIAARLKAMLGLR